VAEVNVIGDVADDVRPSVASTCVRILKNQVDSSRMIILALSLGMGNRRRAWYLYAQLLEIVLNWFNGLLVRLPTALA
jgi:hypothetical protein